MFYVYILLCADKSLYTGITTDIARRFEEHKQGIGSRYTRAKKAKRIVHVERRRNRSSAAKREAQIKKLSRAKKMQLVQASARRF